MGEIVKSHFHQKFHSTTFIELNSNTFSSSFMLHTGDFLTISYNKVYHSNGPLKCKLS